MLSTDSFRINGDTLFYVVKQKPPKSWITAVNRPCDTCNGAEWVEATNHAPGCEGVYCEQMCPIQVQDSCPNCKGTGRYTFEITHEWNCDYTSPTIIPNNHGNWNGVFGPSTCPKCNGLRHLRAHFIDMLPVIEVDPPNVPYPNRDALVKYAGDSTEPWFIYTKHDDMTETVWDVPSVIHSGMYVVRFKVHNHA